MGGTPKNWNVGVLPANNRFEITTIWSSLKGQVEFGDQVVNINGKSLEGLPLSQVEVDNIFNAIEGDESYIVVLKDGVEKKIGIAKE